MSDFIKTAKSFIGVKQGSKRHKHIIDTYNSMKPLPSGYKVKYSDYWCATFTSYCAYVSGLNNFPYECSVQRMYNKAVKSKQIVKTPKVGYLVIYDWNCDGSLDHVGIITDIKGDTLYVCEGNYCKQVKMRVIPKTYKEIYCYIKTSYITKNNITNRNTN